MYLHDTKNIDQSSNLKLRKQHKYVLALNIIILWLPKALVYIYASYTPHFKSG